MNNDTNIISNNGPELSSDDLAQAISTGFKTAIKVRGYHGEEYIAIFVEQITNLNGSYLSTGGDFYDHEAWIPEVPEGSTRIVINMLRN